MQSINRVMKIVDAFISVEPIPYLSITELSNKSGLPASSLHRILQAMIKQNMIKQDKERKLYTLGSVWLEYGLKVYDTMDYISHIRPELELLMQNVNSSVYLIQPHSDDSIIIERIDCPSQTIRTYDKLGLRVPIYEGIANLSMLANMKKETLDKLKNTNPNEEWPCIEEKLKQIKDYGYAIGEDEWSSGITTIATAIVDHYGNVFGALCVKLEKSETNLHEDLINKLIDTGNKISWKVNSY